MIYLNFLTWAIAVSAFTYSNILTEPGMILYGVHSYLDNKLVGAYRWIFDVIIHCQFCISGQWALWGYIYLKIDNSAFYNPFTHIWFIMQTIFMAKVITWLYYTVFKF